MNIYTDVSILTQNNRKNLIPPLAHHWSGIDDEMVRGGGKNCRSRLSVTSDPSEAEWFMLPMHWSYYLWNSRRNMPEAEDLAKLAERYKKKLIIWHKGDLVPIIPFENAITFLPGVVRSRQRDHHRACPVFVDDPSEIFDRSESPYRKKQEKPTIGFCGYASVGAAKTLWSVLRRVQLNLSSRLGRYDYEAIPVIPATIMRARALKILSRHKAVKTRFIIRDKYTGTRAQNTMTDHGDASQVFFSNIYDSDYTLCARGYGNWSYRFYETLACGRIPIFIDTESVLPVHSLDWKKYCVWVDESEVNHIGEKVADFHASLSQTDFVDLQAACRRLWLEQFTPEGFTNHFYSYL